MNEGKEVAAFKLETHKGIGRMRSSPRSSRRRET